MITMVEYTPGEDERQDSIVTMATSIVEGVIYMASCEEATPGDVLSSLLFAAHLIADECEIRDTLLDLLNAQIGVLSDKEKMH